MKNFYDILGVPKNAKKEEIKKAYHKLAHKHHPDKSGGDDQRFKEINEAYQVLMDDKKRTEYDRYGRVFSDNSGGNAGREDGFGFEWSGNGSGNENFQGFDFSEIFEDFFGFENNGRGRKMERGRDVFIDIEISFKEVIFGAERRVMINKPTICEMCHGNGAEPKSELLNCETCNGTGKIREMKKSFFGSVVSMRECSRCKGKGKIPQKFCENCKGVGILKKNEEILIKVPAGIENGEMIKISGRGESVVSGISGDLYIKIHVAKEAEFSREGMNILMTLDIPITDAILGGERIINLFGEKLKVKIPKGTDSEDILKIKDKGIVYNNKMRGYLLIKIKARTPKKLSRRAEDLINELKKEGI